MLEAKVICTLNTSKQYYWKSQIRLLIPLAGVTWSFDLLPKGLFLTLALKPDLTNDAVSSVFQDLMVSSLIFSILTEKLQ